MIALRLALTMTVLAPAALAGETRRALLIGIDEYLSPSVSDLAGCANDVDLVRELLIGKFELAPENVRVLKNAEATGSDILTAIRSHLIEPSVDGDVAILHFSGHGSQMIDVSGDELDGLDETIVPHDSRQDGVFDISDDEINGLMAELSRKTPHVTFILDSCHSGSAARAAEVGNRVRQTPPDMRRPPAPEPFALGARGVVEGPDDFRLPGSDYVLISGCRANELSNETQLGERRHGALSYFLERALRSAGESVSYREVMEQVAADVPARFPKQHPQFEGTGLDTAVFGVERLLPRAYVLVDPDPVESERAKIAAGSILGLVPGVRLDVYPPGERLFDDPLRSTARLRIAEVDLLAASGVLESGTVAPGSRAILGVIRPPDFAAGVWLDSGLPAPLLAALRTGLTEHDSMKLAADREAAQIRVGAADGGVVLEGRDRDLLDQVAPGERLAERALDRIAHWARWHAILAIDNPNPDLQFDLELRRAGTVADASPLDAVPVGTTLELAATNRSREPIHLVVLDLASDGSVGVLYPRAGILEAIPPGRRVPLRRLGTSVGEGRDFDVDYVKAIATTEPIPAGLFELGPVPRAAAPAPRADESALERFLRRSTQGLTRKLDPVDVDGWAVRQTSFRVVKPDVETRGFVAHFETEAAASRAEESLGGTRAICATPADPACFELEPMAGDPTMVRLRTPEVRSGERDILSVGEAFEQAYALARESGAERVEPLLDYRLPHAQTAPHPDAPESRGVGGEAHDSRAESDDLWSLKYARVPEAWEALRAAGKPTGAEARGVVVAHPDTGYRQHPELVGPLWPEMGWDYYGGDADPTDDLLSGRPLDNPAHGTGSGSAIVSPPGCQLAGASKCPTGAAQGARLVPLRVHRSVVHFSTERLTQAILDASGSDRTRVKTASDVMSISMGGAPSWALWKAARKAEERGYLIVAAAGNYVGSVVWPARFDSVIAVGAVNAGCKPWAYTSHGPAVDFSAPGESVWRGALDVATNGFVNTMGTGTTYATASTAGIAALWIARHKGAPAFEALRRDGAVVTTFRRLVQETSWRPGAANRPPATRCDSDARWARFFLGDGIIDAAALLAAPLGTPAASRAAAPRSLTELPLWSSLYAGDEPLELVVADYRRLFRAGDSTELESIAPFEAEITHHYATDEWVAAAIDAIASRDDRSVAAFAAARSALRLRDLSASLRAALAQEEGG